MNTTNFNKMGLIKVNGQWRFPTEEDKESEESTDATVDASYNADSGAPEADANKDNVEGGATEGAAGNAPIDIKDDTTGENEKNSEFSKFTQDILDELDAISIEQKSNQETNITRFENLEQQVEAVLDKLATMAVWNEPIE